MVTELKSGYDLYNAFNSLLMNRFYERSGKGVNLSSGNPLLTPFSPAVEAAKKSMDDYLLSLYGSPRGEINTRKILMGFSKSMGLAEDNEGLNENNIIPGLGITHLYTSVLEVLANKARVDNPGKTPVILMSSPTYGLFSIQPESFDFKVDTFELKKEDGWQIDPDVLEEKIKSINKSENRCVCAFYRVNPSNPMGVVESETTTEAIAKLLKANNVFAIDDMAYHGQEYKKDAVPLAKYSFDNAVSLFSLSKTYCMANLRAGFMCGPEDIIGEARDITLRVVQSVPRPAEAALSSTFCNENRAAREKYVSANKAIYLERYRLLKALINGVDNVEGLSRARQSEIVNMTKAVFADLGDSRDILENGVRGVNIVNDEPGAGYFSVLDWERGTDLYYGTTKISNSFQLAAVLVDQGKVLSLPMASAMANEHLPTSVRVTFGVSEKAIIKGVKGLYYAGRSLTSSPDYALQDKLHTNGLSLGARFQ